MSFDYQNGQNGWETVTHSKSHKKELKSKGRKNAKDAARPQPKNFWEHIVASFGEVCIEDEYDEDEYHKAIVLRKETKQIVFSMDGKFVPRDTGRHNREYQVNGRVIVEIFEPENSDQIDVGFSASINIDRKMYHDYDRTLRFGPIEQFKNVCELKELTDRIANGDVPAWLEKK